MAESLTPYQHHFPHFLDISRLHADLKPSGLRPVIHLDPNTKEDVLALKKTDKTTGDVASQPTITIGAGTFLMVDGAYFYGWQRFTNGLLIRQFKLHEEDIHASMQEDFIDILEYPPGIHHRKSSLRYRHFVTFVRKSNLHVAEDWYERFVILYLHEDQMQIIPMDAFNETGGDPMYVWPALASLNPETMILYGHGMRMGSFQINLPSLHG